MKYKKLLKEAIKIFHKLNSLDEWTRAFAEQDVNKFLRKIPF